MDDGKIFQFVVRRSLDPSSANLPLGLRLVFAPRDLCYAREINERGLVAEKNRGLQKWPEVASQGLQQGDIFLAVNDYCDHDKMSRQLHTAFVVHICVYRAAASEGRSLDTANPSASCRARPSPSFASEYQALTSRCRG